MTNVKKKDQTILRDLAKRYVEICCQDVQEERRILWRDHNSLVKTRPPILCSWHWGSNLGGDLLADVCECEDPFLRTYELELRNLIFHDTLGDDHVFEPWVTVRAVMEGPSTQARDQQWGIAQDVVRDPASQGWRVCPAIKTREDVKRMVATHHQVSEEETERRVGPLRDALGNVLEVNVDRSSYYGLWGGSDLSTALGYLRGRQEFMADIYENPELLREMLTFMRDAVLMNFDECEAAGDWKLANHISMGESYARELPDPKPNGEGVKMKDLWFFTCAQEFTLVSPQHHWEFLLQYQMPIMEKFGLVAYGCCEDLTRKIDLLRRIPDLRRIGVTPRADVARCAEQIGRDYVVSWKPNPAMICASFDPDYIRRTLHEGLEAGRGCNVDIMLKDIGTVQGETGRLMEWTRIARELAEEF